MVRRTKADADATRDSLLDAAELLFQSRGVSRTSLNDIAVAAGTTRGAIYWHFNDKADLFNAMMDRATLPLEETIICMGAQAPSLEDPLQALRNSLLDALSRITHDAHVRRVIEVATLQVEYNEEMRAVRERHLEVRQRCMTSTTEGLRAAATRLPQPLPIPLDAAALGLFVVVDGLIHNWLLDSEAFDLESCGRQTIDTYLRGLGFTLPDAPAPRPLGAPRATASPGAGQRGTADSPTPARSRTRTG